MATNPIKIITHWLCTKVLYGQFNRSSTKLRKNLTYIDGSNHKISAQANASN